MIQVKFIAQSKTDKNNKYSTNKVAFDEYDEMTAVVINTQRTCLEVSLKDHRILCLIENVEEE